MIVYYYKFRTCHVLWKKKLVIPGNVPVYPPIRCAIKEAWQQWLSDFVKKKLVKSTGALVKMKNPEKIASKHDQEILNCIFNPLQPLEESFNIHSAAEEEGDEPESDIIKEAKQLEIEGVKAAENGKTTDAVEIFSKAIQVAPSRPSGYNNRAQAYRLIEKDEEAMLDLNNAINLSNGKGHAACQAYCQRGMLFRKLGKDPEAKSDFEEAAKLGSNFAKSQLVEMNPYAALCNKMLHDVFTKLRNGDVE